MRFVFCLVSVWALSTSMLGCAVAKDGGSAGSGGDGGSGGAAGVGGTGGFAGAGGIAGAGGMAGTGGTAGAGGMAGAGGTGGDPAPLTRNIDFVDAAMTTDGVVHFYVESSNAVERLDLVAKQWLTPLEGSAATTDFAVSPDGATVYLSYEGGRIDEFDTDTGEGNFFSATPETASTIHVAGPYLFTIDASGAWDSHSLYDRATGARLFTDEWRDTSRSIVYAPIRQRLLFLDSGSSPTDINYVDVNTDTGTLGEEIDSPYHGAYSLPSPIRLTPDEQSVVVGNGNHFSVETLEYTTSFGLPFDDLVFYESDLYLFDSIGDLAQIRVLDSGFNILDAEFVPGAARRLFVHEDELVVITDGAPGIEVRFLPLPLE